MSKTLWICGKIVIDGQWEICGVFSEEQKAIDACKSYLFFIGPMTLDEELPDITQEWSGVYYPFPEKLP